MSQTFNCPNCNAPLDYPGSGSPTIRCPYCQSSVVVPEELRGGASQPEELPLAPDEQQPTTSPMDIAANVQAISELARAGNKIAAIALFRRTFNVSLLQAKEAVEAIQRGEAVNLSNFTVSSPTTVQTLTISPEVTEQIHQLLNQGKKIEAIKVYREATGQGLVQAKETVDAMEEGFRALGTFRSAPTTIDQATVRKIARGAGAATAGGGCCTGIITGVILLGVLVFVLFMLTLPGGPLAEPLSKINPFGATRVTLSFGGEGTGPGLFQDVRHVAMDNNGHLWVGEYEGGRIQVFDDSGKFITQWTPKIEGTGDIYVTGMAADRQGNVYVVVGSELYKYNGLTGELLGKLEHPEGWGFDDVTVAPDGSVVAAWYKSQDDIIRFKPNGQVDLIIPNAISNVSGDSELDMKVAVDGLGNIYALGTFNESVFKYSPDGNYISRFGSEGEEKGQFTSPYGIAVDNHSRIYVSDFDGLLVFANDGRYLQTISTNSFVYGLRFNDQNELFTVSTDKKVRRLVLTK